MGNLGAGNVLLNADGSLVGTETKITLPAAALGDDAIVHTHDGFSFTFAVGLASADLSVPTGFTLRVDIYASKTNSNAARANVYLPEIYICLQLTIVSNLQA